MMESTRPPLVANLYSCHTGRFLCDCAQSGISALLIANDSILLQAKIEDSDQTTRMQRLFQI